MYENALAHEMRERGLTVLQQQGIAVRYKGVLVGEYAADFLVEDQIIVELKTVRALHEQHTAQCLNYLRAFRPWFRSRPFSSWTKFPRLNPHPGR